MVTLNKLNTLVLGGYGNFGKRVCQGLANDAGISLWVAGRHEANAKALATMLGGQVQAVGIDHRSPSFVPTLRALGIRLVIHTAGPFQSQAYDVALAAAAAGAHYVDLSDGRRFVCDFPSALDAAFRQAGRVAVAGASTVPALSSAVVDDLCRGWARIDTIDTCIAPAQTAPRGVATIAAVLSYCGQPIRVWDGGQWREHVGWANPRTVDFARLKPRLGALCDIPDLELFPTHYGVRDRVIFRAALEVPFTQRVFALMAWMRVHKVLGDPTRWAGLLANLAPLTNPFGSSLGGMVVRVSGLNEHSLPARRAWHIAADDDHGPEIPCMAAILLARQIATNTLAVRPGAHTSLGLLPLSAFEPLFQQWSMHTMVDD
jgi:hypothetical protein